MRDRGSHRDVQLQELHPRDVTRKPLLSVTVQSFDDKAVKDASVNKDEQRFIIKPSITSRIRQKYAPDAWQFVVGSGALAGLIVLLVNIIAIIVICSLYQINDHAAVIYTGNCSTSAKTVLGLHIVINILSTVLLACSNYSMQCLSAPSRQEVDAAHEKKRWLSIGVQNIRNLFSVSKIKAFLWVVLAISSFPLHLLWNSVVFQTLTANNYVAVSVTSDFLTGASWTRFGNESIDSSVQKLQQAAQANQLSRLEPADCIRAYGQQLQHNRRDVILVSEPANPIMLDGTKTSAFAAYNNPFRMSTTTTFRWICGDTIDSTEDGGVWACDASYLETFAATSSRQWIPGEPDYYDLEKHYGDQQNISVSYCLSEEVPEQCKVSVVPMFLGIVIACNVIKIAAFLATLRISRQEAPLITTGDAIKSFLKRSDPVTVGRCLVSKDEYDTVFTTSKEWRWRPRGVGDGWSGGRSRWGRAVRWYHWWLFMLPASTAIILAGSFYGPNGFGDGVTETWPIIGRLGLGKPQTNFNLTIGSTVDFVTAVLSANIPQLIVTYVYLFFNNIMTAMLAMAEWCSFSSQPAKGLRVSSPDKKTEQRSTYFLQVPYRYSIPSTICIATLHWLVSQMVFMAKIDVYDLSGNLTPAQRDDSTATGSITSVYFSPLAMLLAVSLASVLLLILIGFALFAKYPSHVPLAACCSASLSAMCQLTGYRDSDEELTSKRLVWGVVEVPRGEYGVGHATFSSLPVGKLQVGSLYA